jgi:hypothetical protein
MSPRPEEEEQEQEHAEEEDNKGRPSSFFSSSSSSSALPVKDGIRQQDILPGRGKVDHRTYLAIILCMWLARASMTRLIDGSDCLLNGRPTEKFVLLRK